MSKKDRIRAARLKGQQKGAELARNAHALRPKDVLGDSFEDRMRRFHPEREGIVGPDSTTRPKMMIRRAAPFVGERSGLDDL